MKAFVAVAIMCLGLVNLVEAREAYVLKVCQVDGVNVQGVTIPTDKDFRVDRIYWAIGSSNTGNTPQGKNSNIPMRVTVKGLLLNGSEIVLGEAYAGGGQGVNFEERVRPRPKLPSETLLHITCGNFSVANDKVRVKVLGDFIK